MMTLQRAQEICEEYAPTSYYHDHYRGWEGAYYPQVVEMLERGDLVPEYWTGGPGRALDVGPGWGSMAIYLASHNWKVQVVDCVPIGTFMTHELLGDYGITYHHVGLETAETLPTPISDLVLMGQVLGHLRYRPDNALKRVAKWVAPGGVFLCHNLDHDRTPNAQYAYERWQDMPLPFEANPVSDMNTCHFTLPEYEELLSQVYRNVRVWRDEHQPILFGVCRDPLEG